MIAIGFIYSDAVTVVVLCTVKPVLSVSGTRFYSLLIRMSACIKSAECK